MKYLHERKDVDLHVVFFSLLPVKSLLISDKLLFVNILIGTYVTRMCSFLRQWTRGPSSKKLV